MGRLARNGPTKSTEITPHSKDNTGHGSFNSYEVVNLAMCPSRAPERAVYYRELAKREPSACVLH